MDSIEALKDEIRNVQDALKQINSSKETAEIHPKEITFGLFGSVESFTGRTEEIENLHKALTIAQSAAITGLGGIGKTSLAVKYAERQSKFYHNAVMIKSEKVENIVKSFISLAKTLLIQTEIEIIKENSKDEKERQKRERDIHEIVQDVYSYLDNDERKSLIILDNVEDYNVVKDFIFKGHVKGKNIYTLVTSRRKNWDAGQSEDFEMISLEVFSEKDAIDYLNKNLEQENQEDVRKLTEVLERLPLALTQSVGYIQRRNINAGKWSGMTKFTIAEYLRLFREKQQLLIESDHDQKDHSYDKNLRVTWELSLEQIQKHPYFGDLALKIFYIIAYLSPEDIKIEKMFSRIEKNIENIREATEILDEHSLINLENGQVNVHRLIQKMTRLNLSNKNEEEKVLRTALDFLNLSPFEEHAVCIWEYSSKYLQIIEDYYGKSIYGEMRHSPLHLLAANRDDCKAIENICTHCKDIDLNSGNSWSRTPLDMAVQNGNKKTVKYLVEKGAIINRESFVIAAANGHDEVVKFLLSKDETLAKYRDYKRESALDAAVLKGHPQVVSALMPKCNEELMYRAKLRQAMIQKNTKLCEELIKVISDIYN
ncbi:uncharacterized protein LOC143919712 [Arctopsyche grandis]|uniref:uncharacterized protein LOC143919712 n=1 Tax=Arctopsyche grandis TaxID=121162 RepID=UPI00406D7F96